MSGREPVPQRRGRRRSWVDRIPQPVAVLMVLAVVLGIWQLVVSAEIVSSIVVPSPLGTIREVIFVMTNLITGGYMLGELWITLQEILAGFLLAAVAGFTLGVVVGATEFGRKGVMPLLVSLNTMPKVAFAPVFVAWFGFGIFPKVLMACIVAIFPVIVTTAAGLRAVGDSELKLFTQLRASRFQTLVKLQLPAALPSIFSGLRTASVFCVIGAIIGEFLGGGSGFGELIRVGSSMLRIERVFGLIVCLSVVGLTLFSIVDRIERRVVFWQRDKSGNLSQSGSSPGL